MCPPTKPVAPVTQAVSVAVWALRRASPLFSCPAYTHSHRSPMRSRCILTAVAAACAVAGPAAGANAAVAPGKVIVRYHGDATHAERVRAQRHTGVATRAILPGGTRELEIADGDSIHATLAELRSQPSVAYAVPDYVAHTAEFVPNDPGRDSVAGGWRGVQWNFIGENSVNAPAAWDLARDAG